MQRSSVMSIVSLMLGLGLVLSTGSCGLAGEDTPRYIRIAVGPKHAIYVQFMGDEMRLATSAEGLKDATPVKATRDVWRNGRRQVQFPEVALPLPPAAPESRPLSLKASLGSVSAGSRDGYIFGQLILSRTDGKKVRWEYRQNVGMGIGLQPDAAPVVQAADPDNLSIEIVTQQGRGSRDVAIALRVKAGQAQLDDIMKDGKNVEAGLRVLDGAGKEVVSEKGPLSNFGFG